MMKTLTAGLTALSLILVPAAPVHAQTDQTEMQRTLLSLLAIGGIALAIKSQEEQNRKDRAERQDRARPQVQPPVKVHDNGRSRNHGGGWSQQSRRQPDLVPGRCFRRVELPNGRYQGVFGEQCLERRYRDAHTLPRQCRVRIGGRDGSRRGYEANCLRDFGYQSDRRWH